jgi:hypothetical protein
VKPNENTRKRPECICVVATSEPPAKIQASPINSWPGLDQAARVQLRFNKLVNQNPTAYVEKICVSYLADHDKDVIHEETIRLAKLQKNIYNCQEKVLQLSGIGDEYSRVDSIRKVICTTISWVEEIFCYAIIDWAEVQRIHSERAFAYQSI